MPNEARCRRLGKGRFRKPAIQRFGGFKPMGACEFDKLLMGGSACVGGAELDFVEEAQGIDRGFLGV